MDNRMWESGASATPPSPPASPSSGYPSPGNPTLSEPATTGGAWWFHQMGEELRAVLAEAGITPSTADLTQLLQALKKIKQFNEQIFTATGNFTTPANINTSTVFKITLIGPGAGGGGCSGVTIAQGGGAGGAASFLISGLQPSTSYSVTIGAPGNGGASGNNNGTAGGTTSIVINGTTYSVNGGALGAGTASSQYQFNPGIQGTVSASITALPSAVVYKQTGSFGFYLAALNYLASAGASLQPWGNGGYSGGPSGSGVGYGAGGTGATAGQGGGAGAPSAVIIEWIA